ncbi:hypothetical protein LUZ61_012513 [Rhynchospora tenuis]|uniref:F-box/LRR-repeat protein 15/At3g58940/PEG3-like LRR domain-containing protein n=1 Tax=Rhynchospora tenuis TaxID=198213 RepID=A0AAD6F1K6_9POAL|nr:hypothetical protein LUZ61_012513 [Rhynchospora tenuis]
MAGADRISLLPLEIKISLLSRLRVKDAVRTSALAHSWRHLWTLLPCLQLHCGLDRLGLVIPRDDRFDSLWMERVHEFVSPLRGPVLDFQLFYCCPDSDGQSIPLLQRLLDLLLRKGGVEKLLLYNFSNAYRVVISLSGFHALKELELSDCHLVLPTGFPGFNRLTKLLLVDTQISSEDINLLIHTSTNLTSLVNLTLIASKDPLSVNFSFPLLRCLQFCITDSVERVSISSAPCLEKACISFDSSLINSMSEKLARITLGLVTSVAMVSSLTLGFDALKNFSLVALPFNFTFSRLRFLSFYLNMDTVDKRMYDASIWLLKSMPFLEELEIELWGDNSSQTNGVVILMRELLAKKHDGFACLDRTLRSVTIDMYKLEVTASITMAHIFLLNAKVLKELKIVFATGAKVMPSMIEELQKLDLISSDAKVVIFDRIKKKKIILCMNN